MSVAAGTIGVGTVVVGTIGVGTVGVGTVGVGTAGGGVVGTVGESGGERLIGVSGLSFLFSKVIAVRRHSLKSFCSIVEPFAILSSSHPTSVSILSPMSILDSFDEDNRGFPDKLNPIG